MYLIDTVNTVSVSPQQQPGVTAGGYFVDEDPTTGAGGTEVSADWLNMVQGEFRAICDRAGVVYDKTNSAQVLASLNTLFLPRGNTLQGSVEDNYTLAINSYHAIALNFSSLYPGVIFAATSANLSGQAPGVMQLLLQIDTVTPSADKTTYPMSNSGAIKVAAGSHTITSTFSSSASGNPNVGHTVSFIFVPT